MSGWGCPHEDKGGCLRREAPCDPGAEGCVLEGRLVPVQPRPPETARVPTDRETPAAEGGAAGP